MFDGVVVHHADGDESCRSESLSYAPASYNENTESGQGPLRTVPQEDTVRAISELPDVLRPSAARTARELVVPPQDAPMCGDELRRWG